VAAEMARRGRGASLVLVAPFVSLTAVASRFLPWWLPAGWVVPDRFDTLSKARDVRIPTLVVHDGFAIHVTAVPHLVEGVLELGADRTQSLVQRAIPFDGDVDAVALGERPDRVEQRTGNIDPLYPDWVYPGKRRIERGKADWLTAIKERDKHAPLPLA
jgi:hypothetical protein